MATAPIPVYLALPFFPQIDATSAYAVAARFGLRGHEPATFAIIGKELGVTPQAVRRRVESAITKLRTHAEPIAA